MNPKNYRIPYKESLNPSQYEVVFFNDGPLLVIAGAGSGKTRTLTYRVARLVEDGVPPHAILLLTFTRKAAQEMLLRATRLLDNRCERVAGGTFHAFANSMLRRYAAQLNIDPGFTIMDRPDAESLIGIIRKEMGLGLGQRSFPRKQTLADIFSKAVNKVLSAEEVIYKEYPHFIPYADDIVSLYNIYIQRKVGHNFLDYDDLLVYLMLLLKNRSQVREEIAASYQYIMVDEYQDTNLIQADIVSLITDSRKNIMVVGDDSQSIYSFRGAHFKNIIRFPELFPGTKIIRLEENYRSGQPILDLANLIIERAAEKYTKVLFTRKTTDVHPVLATTRDENSQSLFVVERIEDLHARGVPYTDIAVLFRAAFHSFDLEIELNQAGIPFVKVGGFKFAEAAHIKDLLAHLKVLRNPNDRISWYRILMLCEKVGPRTAEKMFDLIQKEERGWAGISSAAFSPQNAKRIRDLKNLLETIAVPNQAIAGQGEAILEYYAPLLADKFDDHPRRLRDLEHLLSIMERYHDLEDFLTDMALEPPATGVDNTFLAGPLSEERLTLSTIHSAKGLEWHTVFIIWALEGRFPSLQYGRRPEELEEELRLMYVAATRAKEGLYITYPSAVFDRGSGSFLSRPSRFIDQIPDRILRKEFVNDF